MKKAISPFNISRMGSRMISAILVFTMSFSMTYGQEIEEIFLNPPNEAKPRGYWLWAHGNFDYARIKEELKAFQEMGLGGADIFDMGLKDAFDVIPPGNQFMGQEMVDGIVFALNEAKKLNLSMGLSVSNGWNAGGDWTRSDEKLMRLLFWKDTIEGPKVITDIGFPEVPETFKKPYGTFELYPDFDENGFPAYYKDVSLVAFPLLPSGLIPDLSKVISISTDEIDGNKVNIKLPAGKWVIARAVVTPLGQKMWMRSDQSNGYIMDHYAKNATKRHFEYVIEKLESRLGDMQNTALERLYLASFEAEDYVIWSPELRTEFFEQHGYQIDEYIPIFAGQTIIDRETTDRFLHDYRSTVSEMFVNNHYRQASEICRSHGLLLASESGGPGPPLHYVPTEDLKALGSVDIMRGEFWNKKSEYFDENGNDLLQVVKNIGSAAHIYGHKIVEMEAFTSHGKHWQEQPIELKKLADKAFCEGMTRVVYHTMTHSPKEAGYPGWSYSAGTHISPKLTWWELSKPFHSYLARTSAMLQQGINVADVAYYYGEQIPNFASGSKYVRKSLGQGYAYDDLNKEILLQSSVTKEGYISLPSGMKYRLLVLPEDPQMSLEVAGKVKELVMAGAVVLGDRPTTVPGLKDYKKREADLRDLVDSFWPKSGKRRKNEYGKGKIYSGYEEREILSQLGVMPDFSIDSNIEMQKLDFIHRATQKEDIYFIRNEDSAKVEVKTVFRIKASQPYNFNPKTGEITKIAFFTDQADGTELQLSLEPLGSTIIVFKHGDQILKHVTAVEMKNPDGTEKLDPSGLEVYYDRQDQLVIGTANPGEFRVTLSDNSTKTVSLNGVDEEFPFAKTWDVRFPHGWGFEPLQEFETLIDWKSHDDENLASFSGIATYKSSFSIPEGSIDSNQKFFLDLGKVGEVARVFLNGKEVGTSVFPPFRFNVTDELREGNNYISIEVANTWLNQLIKDTKLPYEQQRTSSNVGSGDRAMPQRHWQHLDPMPSGLIGPVKLVSKEFVVIPN